MPFSTLKIGMTYCIALDNTIYSASMVNNAILVCRRLAYKIGNPARVMYTPVLDMTTPRSSPSV